MNSIKNSYTSENSPKYTHNKSNLKSFNTTYTQNLETSDTTHFKHKSNSGNTLTKFFRNEVENVKKLNFFEPDRKKDEYSLYYLKIFNMNEKIMQEERKNLNNLKECNNF